MAIFMAFYFTPAPGGGSGFVQKKKPDHPGMAGAGG